MGRVGIFIFMAGVMVVLVDSCPASPPVIEPESVTPTATTEPAETSTSSGWLSGLSRSSNLLGDMFGFRTLLSKYGMSLSLSETSEVLGNVTGGVKTGFDYDGLTQMALQLDTQRAFGCYGGTFNVSGLQIHGRNLSADNLDHPCKPPAASKRIRRPGSGNCGISRNFSKKTGST